MSMLSVIQDFAGRTGIPVPSFVVGTTDSQIVQLQGTLREVLDDLCERWVWQQLTVEATFVTVAAEDQGALSTLAPNGFSRIIDETMFDRTDNRPVLGQLSAQNWQLFKASSGPGTLSMYRLRGDRLRFLPAPPAGHTIAFEYASRWACTDSAGANPKTYPTADSDLFVFQEMIIQAGVRAFWKREKGLDYAEEMRRYEEVAANAAARNAPRRRIDMSGGCGAPRPGIIVPEGNWSV